MSYVCLCPNLYTGLNCQICNYLKDLFHFDYFSSVFDQDTNPCSNNPCQNGAVCQITALGAFKCICPTFFSGTYCQTSKCLITIILANKFFNFYLFIDTNACSFNSCLNGATCEITGNGNTFRCICPINYTGTYCQTCKLILKQETYISNFSKYQMNSRFKWMQH